MPDALVPRAGIFVPGLHQAGDFDQQNRKCFQDPIYGFAERSGYMQSQGLGAPSFCGAPGGFGMNVGIGSGYGLAGPVGDVGYGPYSIYGGYYNGYVPNAAPPPQYPCSPVPPLPAMLPPPMPGTSGIFVQHPVYATRYGSAPFNYYHFDAETQQYVGAYVTQVHIGAGYEYVAPVPASGSL